MIQRDIRAMHPRIQGLVADWLRRCSARGFTVLVTETTRTNALQRAYFARGRRPLADVQALYREQGLRPPTAAENLSTITGAATALDSWHFYGLALDFVPIIAGTTQVLDWLYDPKLPDGRDNPKDFWDEIEQEAEHLGFLWGGNWANRKDRPHIEWHPGVTLDQARVWGADHHANTWLPL